MKKLLLQVIILTFISQIAYNQPVVFDWSTAMGGRISNGNTVSIAKDAAGDLYIYGGFNGNRDFGSFNLIASGSTDVFVAKYSPTGTCLWAVKGGFSFSNATAGKIAVSGNTVYVVGSFYNAIQFGTIGVSGIGNSDIFIASLDASNGAPNWVQKAGGAYDENGIGISNVTGGGVYISGMFAGTAVFGSYTLSSASIIDNDLFYARYDALGNCSWAYRIGSSSGEEKATAIKEAPGGDVYFTGSFEGTVTFGTGIVLSSYGAADYFLAKMSSAGTVVWTLKGGGGNTDVGTAIDIDQAGNVYSTGLIADTATFGTITINNNQNVNIFVCKHNAFGVCEWVKMGGGMNADIGSDISADAGGSSYVTGYITGNVNFGSTPITGVIGTDGFIAKYDLGGTLRWVTKVGGSGYDQGLSIISTTNGYCYNSGEFEGTMTLGSNPALSTIPGVWAGYLTRVGGGTVNLQEHDNHLFTCYPNPANHLITLNLEKIRDDIFTVELIDLSGKVVLSQLMNQTINLSEAKIATDQYPAGLYLLKIITSSGEFSKPVSLIHD